jgi:hypothetical protein
MAAWQPLSQFPEFAADVSAAAATGPTATTPPPIAPPPPPPGTVPVPVVPAPGLTTRTGLPWENRNGKGAVSAFVETLQMVLTRPAEAFSIMKREGGLGESLLYGLIGGCLGVIVSFLFSFAMHAMGIAFGARNMWSSFGLLGAGGMALLILVPIFVVVGLFIGAAIVHLCLMIVGGARHSFETTFRVVAYNHGSTGVLQMVPFCGGIIAGVWAIVVSCIGLARAHETETWRAVVAVFLPLIVCCGLSAICAALFIPAIMHSVNH